MKSTWIDLGDGIYTCFFRGTQIFRSNHGYGFKKDSLIWFSSEQQIIKFLTL